jgi:hypothetical protein
MPNFFRLYDNVIYDLGHVDRLGFDSKNAYQIPDEYIQGGKFILMRMCNGLGDWGIISAMPRLLKQKYPECKIYVPSETLIKRIFGNSIPWKHWPNPELNCQRIFANNPYIDGYVDELQGEIFHDHYRVYISDNHRVPLVTQMLQFWGLDISECQDIYPELYFSDDEIRLGNELINKYIGSDIFGGFICTNSLLEPGQFFDNDINELLIKQLTENKLPYVFYGGTSINNTPFKRYAEVKLDFNEIKVDLRVQLYIRSRAKINIGYQSSIFELICRYSKIFQIEMSSGARENYFDNITYL